MNKPPEGWPRIAAAVFYDDAAKAIDWLCSAFGFEVRLKVEGEGGRIEHSELTFGEGVIMVGSTGGRSDRPRALPCKSPRALGGANTQSLSIWVDSVDEHCQRAQAAGAKIMEQPSTQDYGENYPSLRTYRAEDPEGHQWSFIQRVRDAGPRAN
jgi:uncharacterized glyoxalase superfamily protein PhnB